MGSLILGLLGQSRRAMKMPSGVGCGVRALSDLVIGMLDANAQGLPAYLLASRLQPISLISASNLNRRSIATYQISLSPTAP